MSHRTFLAILVLALAAAGCRHTATASDNWFLGEGSVIREESDGAETFRLEHAEGRLILNGEDAGPYDAGTPIRRLPDGRLLVGGEVRSR